MACRQLPEVAADLAGAAHLGGRSGLLRPYCRQVRAAEDLRLRGARAGRRRARVSVRARHLVADRIPRDLGVWHRRGLPGQRDDHERVRGAPPPGTDGRAGVLDARRRAGGGPLVAIGLLSMGISQNLTWRIMLALGAVPALAVFWLRRQIRETPRFLLAQMEAREAAERAARARKATGIRGVLTERRPLRWLIGASLAWLLFDFVYYGNTNSSPLIVKLVDSHASL